MILGPRSKRNLRVDHEFYNCEMGMSVLKIYNSMSGKKEEFTPLQAGHVGIYVCGMTVYDLCHLGHARVMVAFDVITRHLRHLGYQVTYVRNITDVDDKIFNRAQENGEEFDQLTARFIDEMHKDERDLGVLAPDIEPRATAHMKQIIDMISKLINKGHAYLANNGDIYYRIKSFADYGKLNKRNLDEMRVGVRVDVEKAKENPLDFALWKAAKVGEAFWPSPWGDGRPGWHIECSAMSTNCLGATLDIHGGGPDLKFPHHENEIAQSEAATGKPFVRTWMHAGAVRIDNTKMSKSLGNFFTIRELLAKYNPEVIRYFLLSSHYRSAINYSENNLYQAQQSLERFYTALHNYSGKGLSSINSSDAEIVQFRQRFETAMNDDFNTPEALAVLFDLIKRFNSCNNERGSLYAGLAKELGETLGILQQNPKDFLQGQVVVKISVKEIEAFIQERIESRANKNWIRADEIRDILAEHGVVLDDSQDGTLWRSKGKSST